MIDPKRFDDYSAVIDCNECSHYWDSSCDGVSKGSKATCNSYLATRSVVLPEKIRTLENEVGDLKILAITEGIMLVILYILLFTVGG